MKDPDQITNIRKYSIEKTTFLVNETSSYKPYVKKLCYTTKEEDKILADLKIKEK